MKTILTTFLTLAITNFAFAQQPDKVLARVRYTYSNNQDTLKSGKTRTENMLLFVGKNASLFSSYDKLKHEISEEQKFKYKMLNQSANNKPTAIIIDDRDSRWMNNSTNLFFVKENKLFTKEVIALQAYLVEEKSTEINWKISKDTTSLSGIPCKKATATFEGKNWVAWFAPSLPFQSGPWKLNSLPGLILEAYDEGKDVYFQFAGIENAKEGENLRENDVSKSATAQSGDFNPLDQLIGRDVGNAYFENMIRLPIGAVKINRSQLEKLQAAFKKDPRGFVRAQSGY